MNRGAAATHLGTEGRRACRDVGVTCELHTHDRLLSLVNDALHLRIEGHTRTVQGLDINL